MYVDITLGWQLGWVICHAFACRYLCRFAAKTRGGDHSIKVDDWSAEAVCEDGQISLDKNNATFVPTFMPAYLNIRLREQA